ncbi:MAG: DUF4105 domain-containing protein [Deltaproteobacteria bacterium]|nr:DUF4105 domain-containing protein [Deltaproteobacteria bacterium]
MRATLLVLFGLIFSATAAPAADVASLDELIGRAREHGLADEARWRTLLHYERRHFTPIRRSVVQTEAFFLSPEGARDAEAELIATLAGVLDPGARSARGEPVACSFPARTAYLKERLGFEPPPAPCPALDAWRDQIRPVALTMVFPEAFMDSPASMFGHTLLRLDVNTEDESENLLGYAIDFTADTGGEAGPIYLLKGVLGRYPARFGLNPFWEKLKQYADWQNRDLWEHRLDLSADEIDFVLLHLWELRDVAFPYYFFDENCSYQLVRLLQAARPEIEIRHGFPVSVMPIDTVRDVVAETGTQGEARFRASPATKIRHALRTLPAEEADAFLGLASGEIGPEEPSLLAMDAERRARVLGLAYDALRYRFLDEEVPPPEARERAHRLLLARSQLGLPDLDVEPPAPPVRPEDGHGTAMISLGAGREDDEPFVDLRLRPALHGRLDPGGGHSPDSTIRVLDGTLRYYPALRRVRLHELTLVELRSEAPIDRFFHPPSWHFSTGLATRMRPEGDGDFDREPVWRSEGGVGVTLAQGDWLRVGLLAELRGETGGSLARNGAFGPGLAASLRLGRPTDRAQLQFGARAFRFLAGDRATVLEARIEPTLRLSRNVALVGAAGWNRDEGESWLDGRLALRFYW